MKDLARSSGRLQLPPSVLQQKSEAAEPISQLHVRTRELSPPGCEGGARSAALALRWYTVTTSCGSVSHTRCASLQQEAGLAVFQSTRKTSKAVGSAKLGGHVAGPPTRSAAAWGEVWDGKE